MTCKLHHKMQILVYGWIYNLCDYSTYKAIIDAFFALNLKICRILWFTIWSYDLRSHLLSTILHKISILTTLLLCLCFAWWFGFVDLTLWDQICGFDLVRWDWIRGFVICGCWVLAWWVGFVGCDMGLNFVVVGLGGGCNIGILGWCYGFMGIVVRLAMLDGVAVGLRWGFVGCRWCGCGF